MPDPSDRSDRLPRLESRFDAHVDDFIDLKHLVAELQTHVRAFEAWQIEVQVYLRQVRWLLVLVIAALVTGVINIVLNLELHA